MKTIKIEFTFIKKTRSSKAVRNRTQNICETLKVLNRNKRKKSRNLLPTYIHISFVA